MSSIPSPYGFVGVPVVIQPRSSTGLVVFLVVLVVLSFVILFSYLFWRHNGTNVEDNRQTRKRAAEKAKSASSVLGEEPVPLFMDDPEPPPTRRRLDDDEDLINLDKARKALPVVKNYPDILVFKKPNEALQVYDPLNHESVKDWSKDDAQFKMLCDALSRGLCYSVTKQADAQAAKTNNAKLFENMTKIVPEFKKALDGKYFKIPWGTDWSAFAVSCTRMLAYYLLASPPDPESLPDKNDTVNLILSIIKSPTEALGRPVSNMNAVNLAGPYLIAHYYKHSDMQNIFERQPMQHVHEYLNMLVKRRTTQEGLHQDMAFFPKDSIFTFKPLEDRNLSYLFALDRHIKAPEMYIKAIRKIIYHPTIPLNIMPFNRISSLRSDVEKDAKYGIEVIPSAKYIRYFHKNFLFAVRGQATNMAYFIRDEPYHPYVKKSVLYWPQYRVPLHKDMSPDVPYLQVGFVIDKDAYVVSRENSQHIEERKAEQQPKVDVQDTETEFYPSVARSYVLAYKHLGIFYQTYVIPKIFNNEPYQITEKIIMNAQTETITVETFIDNTKNSGSLFLCAPNRVPASKQSSYVPYKEEIKPNKSKTFRHVYLLKRDSVEIDELEEQDTPIDPEPIMSSGLDKPYRLEAVDNNAIVLYDNNKPKRAAFINLPDETETIKLNEKLAFTFDASERQYVFDKSQLK